MKALLKKIAWGLLLFALLPGLVRAQETGTISGTVTDAETGESLPGVNVVVVETGNGASTDVDGNYTITGVQASATSYTLRASFIGYEDFQALVNVDVGEDVVVDIQLGAGIFGLNEVVVTAFGIERQQRSLGYSTEAVEGEALQTANESNLVTALAGKVAGVDIKRSSGKPGSGTRITIRGNSSLTGNNQPLFVVNGVPISNASDDNVGGAAVFTGGTSNRALDIDPDVIEEITVLKGAAAAALYGSRAANGVVLITTKDGQRGQVPRVTVSSSVRWDDAIIQGYQDEYLQGTDGFYRNGLPPERGGYAEDDGNPQTSQSWGPHRSEVSEEVLADLAVLEEETGIDMLGENGLVNIYDPRETFFRTGRIADNSISLSGGAEATTYFLAFNDLRQQGIAPGTDLNRTQVSASFGTDLSEELNINTSISYTKTANEWLGQGNGNGAYMFELMPVPISYNLKPYEYEDGSQRMYIPGFNNPFWQAEHNGYTSDVDRFVGSAHVSYDILPWLTLSERAGMDTYGDTRKGRTDVGTRGQTNGMYFQEITRTQLNSDLILQLERDLTEDIGLNALVGNNINVRNYESKLSTGLNLSVPGFFDISNASTVTSNEFRSERLLVGVYSQVSLDFRNYLYLNLTGRNDWSSTLPEGNNSYFYPSASLSFIFTDAFELFEDSFLSYGKVRGTVARVGNDAPVYSLATSFVQAAPGDGVRGVINFPFQAINAFSVSNTFGNPGLKPEITTEYEAGINLGFFGGRAGIDATYYDRTTENQIFSTPVSAATGFTNKLVNAGSIRNHGVELSLYGTPIHVGDFEWDLRVNFTKNTTDVVSLKEGVENIFLFGFTSPQIRVLPEKGGYGVIWGTKYRRNGDLPKDEKFKGVSDDALLIGSDGLPISEGVVGAIGNVQPDWRGNLRSTFSFKGLTLSALFGVQRGGDILNFDLFYNTFYGMAEITENRGSTYVYDGVYAEGDPEGKYQAGDPNTTEIVRDQAYYQAHYGNVYENFVEDASYVKLRELSLSYTLPRSWMQPIGLEAATITGIGTNLWIASDFSYGDPAVGSLAGTGNGQGFYHAMTPPTRSYSLGLSLTF